MESDLHRIIASKQSISDDHIRYFMYQILCGLNYIHSSSVIHRDLKPANILVNANCLIKIADFGMARCVAQTQPKPSTLPVQIAVSPLMTQYVMTRWYRAPELLMGRQLLAYDNKVDLWSCGCVLAELYLKRPLFPGDDMIHQLRLLLASMGAPSPAFCDTVPPIVRSIINVNSRPGPVSMAELVPGAPRKVVDLLQHLLVYEPEQRWSASQTLRHIFFMKYRNTEKETTCSELPLVKISFEHEGLSVDSLKSALMAEVARYNSHETEDGGSNNNCRTLSTEASCEDGISSGRTMSADSGDLLLYSSQNHGLCVTYPLATTADTLPVETSAIKHPKTVSEDTKKKLIDSLRKPKDTNRKRIVTATQRRQEKLEKRQRLQEKQSQRSNSGRHRQRSSQGSTDASSTGSVPLSPSGLTDMDKSFLHRCQQANKLSELSVAPIQTGAALSQDEVVCPAMDQLQLLSGGLSALSLLDDLLLEDEQQQQSSKQHTEMTDLMSLFDMSPLDGVELDINFLENYPLDGSKD